jgi:hypothetical protein
MEKSIIEQMATFSPFKIKALVLRVTLLLPQLLVRLETVFSELEVSSYLSNRLSIVQKTKAA